MQGLAKPPALQRDLSGCEPYMCLWVRRALDLEMDPLCAIKMPSSRDQGQRSLGTLRAIALIGYTTPHSTENSPSDAEALSSWTTSASYTRRATPMCDTHSARGMLSNRPIEGTMNFRFEELLSRSRCA